MNRLTINDQVALVTYLKDVARFAERAHPHISQESSHRFDTILQSPAVDLLLKALPALDNVITLSEDELALFAKVSEAADYLALGLHQPSPNLKENEKDHASLDVLFETIHVNEAGETPSSKASNKGRKTWHYPLIPMSATSIFPRIDNDEGSRGSYEALWNSFVADAKKLPTDYTESLLLDGFDTLWQNIAYAIPVAGYSDVSLYDHSKIMSALTVSLFQWHQEHPENSIEESADAEKFLIVQGDFFGIQKFIFATGSQSNKGAAKLLRGRSFQVSLFSELAALSVLQACGLPATSQILNAAGKFMIIAPNTPVVKDALQTVKQTINHWFLENGFGQVSLGLSVQTATSQDFESQNFERLIKQSFEALEVEKYHRFNLTADTTEKVLNADYQYGVCKYNQSFPAKSNGISDFSQDQINLGKWLVKRDMLLIFPEEITELPKVGNYLKTTIFGWKVSVCEAESLQGVHQDAWAGSMVRCWDFTLPTLDQTLPWHGFSRRAINAYVPRFRPEDDFHRYLNTESNEENNDVGTLKTFGHIACENRQPNEHNLEQYLGKVAIGTLKGDVDNLGTIFQKGLVSPSLTKMTALSRYMTQFFSIWLPAFCAKNYPNVYTVFAGGDDFFMIGPWLDTQRLAFDMRQKFSEYVAENPEITFSAGIALTSADIPLPRLSEFAEDALNQAKQHTAAEQDGLIVSKNALTVYGQTITWKRYKELAEVSSEIRAIKADYGMSTSYLYELINVIELMLDKDNIESGMWLSRFRYRTRRFANDLKQIDREEKDRAYQYLEKFFVTNISTYQGACKIPLFNHFYSLRQR